MGKHLASLGMKVMLADVDEVNLKEAEAELKGVAADASHVVAVVTDVSDPQSIEALKNAAYTAFGAVHLLMNNAGIDGGRQGPLAPRTNWDRTLGVNMWGVISGCQTFVPEMQKQNCPGLIINTGSKQGRFACTSSNLVPLSPTPHRPPSSCHFHSLPAP
jgi:NADP-dependent 3-hydroxy acid dehydrogenase YdfG